MPLTQLMPVVAQPGRPLYQTVKETVRQAIDEGVFQPGEQMPSTKELSQRMKVSLVTAHRALQELVSAGILQRTQGRGTFVHDRYAERGTSVDLRVGLIFHKEASLADYYHSQILEGVHRSSCELGIDLVLLRFGEDIRNECNGYLSLNPLKPELEELAKRAHKRQPLLAVGARSHLRNVPSIDVDNIDLARQAVAHLCQHGHRRIGFVGGAIGLSNSYDRFEGYIAECRELGLAIPPAHVLHAAGVQLDEPERQRLAQMLCGADRPTAIFAAGYYLALGVYAAAGEVGLRIPEDLSVIGVDDPISAAHLWPPLTTLRQPLRDMGHRAVTALCACLRREEGDLRSRTLRAELIARKSVGGPPA